MRRGPLEAIARALAIVIAWLALALAAPSPATAQSAGQYRTELNQLQLDMRALWGEIERFQPQASYCNPPYAPLKQPDEMVLAALDARARALADRYLGLRTSLTSFLNNNHRLAAELQLNGSDPLDPKWWQRYDNERNRLLQELNRKKTALQRAPVRNCGPRAQPPPRPVADAQAPSLPRPPTYAPVNFPTVPTQFCSQDEYWKFINEVINPPYLRAAENAEVAAHFRTQVEVAANAYVQAGKPIPAALNALRRRAQAELTEKDRLSDEIAKLRDRARRTPVVDCSKPKPAAESALSPRYGLARPDSTNARIYRAYSQFMDARERCDREVMSAMVAELERLAAEAKASYDGIASSYQGPFDQEETPENLAFWSAEADMRAANQMLTRARAEQARCPCNQPPRSVAAGPAAPALTSSLKDAPRAVASWVEETDRLFDELAKANRARDCARIEQALAQIARRLGGTKPILWASVTPAQYLLKWKIIYLKTRETCRPPKREQESILDSIDEVPVIAEIPTDRTQAALLTYQNQLRAEAGSLPLRWNAILAMHAYEQARVIAETGQMQHASREGRENERENLVLARHGASSPMAMAQTWGNERRFFQLGRLFPASCSGNWSSCAHYTQIVWSRTMFVGCGFYSGRQFDALVCRYSPPGNADGKPVIVPQSQLAIRTFCPLPPLPPSRPSAP
jgi:Cysteine-rich secretory protein family